MVSSLILSLALLTQVPIPSMTVPPTSERSVVFMDRGRVYLVGVESGNVRVLDNLPAPNPTPDDDDRPTPPPPAPTAYKWVTIVLDRNDSGRNSWRDSAAIRDAVKAKDGRITFYGSDEADIDTRRLRPLITEKGLPLVILQDADGKVLTSRKIESESELLGMLK